jgi:hypothetical protein
VWAVGWIWFAGFMMLMLGCWQFVAGLSAIFKDQVFVNVQDYVFKFDLTTWGWIHLLLGVLIALAGFGVFTGAVWARTVGVILAVLVAIAAFGWVPYYPVWAVLTATAAIAVVWALTVHGRDVSAT